MLQKNLHHEIKRFCDEARHAVETWHYDSNHKGIWCDMHVNPHNLPELEGINSVVNEQRFRHVNQFSGGFRHLKKERFRWMLLNIAAADHKFRKQGLLGHI